MNTRRYPRTMQEAFGPYADQRLEPIPERTVDDKIAEFLEVYRQYRVSHGRRYAARIAYQIAFKGLPF
jgi:hypothetical protein